MVKQYLNIFSNTTQSSQRTEHYQLQGNISVRLRSNAVKLRNSIELHCEGNPFLIECSLKSSVSSALVPEHAVDDILNFSQKGQMRLEAFIADRLLLTSTHSIWDQMTKLKLNTFSKLNQKTLVRIGDKEIKLYEERTSLLGFL